MGRVGVRVRIERVCVDGAWLCVANVSPRGCARCTPEGEALAEALKNANTIASNVCAQICTCLCLF